MNLVAQTAHQMLKQGWHCIPLQTKKKKPIGSKWQKSLIKAEEINQIFTPRSQYWLTAGGAFGLDCGY